MQRVGALVYGLGANEPTCTPVAMPLGVLIRGPILERFHCILMNMFVMGHSLHLVARQEVRFPEIETQSSW